MFGNFPNSKPATRTNETAVTPMDMALRETDLQRRKPTANTT
jgi:hypothetical protein